MPLLAKAYIEQGVPVEPALFIETVWKGYYFMVNNDGSCTNEEAFWKAMEGKLPVEGDRSREIALEFYRNAFNQAKASTSPTPLADQIVKEDLAIRALGVQTFLVTDTMENNNNLAYETDYSGTMRDLLAFVDALPTNAEA